MHVLALCLACLAQDPAFSVTGGHEQVRAGVLDSVRQLTKAAVERLAPRFPGLRPEPFAVWVHEDQSSVPEVVLQAVHEGTAGVALLSALEVHLILDRVGLQPPRDVQTVVDHEVAHILLHQSAGDAGPYVPRWFHEGLAQELTGSTYLGVSEEDIVFDARAGRLLFFSRLRNRFPSSGDALRKAYAQSFSFVSFLSRRVGLPVLLAAVRGCGPERTFSEAFRAQTGTPLVVLESEWVDYVNTGSGAGLRILLGSCFGLMMAAALPLLVLAGRRRWNRDYRSRTILAAQELNQESGRAECTAERDL